MMMLTKDSSMMRESGTTILASDEVLELVPIKAGIDVDYYLQVHKENDVLGNIWDEHYENHLRKEISTGKAFYCSIYLVDTDEYIGYCGINNIDEEERDLAIELLKRHQQKGYGFRAMKCLIACRHVSVYTRIFVDMFPHTGR